jgi:hypothetical protein
MAVLNKNTIKAGHWYMADGTPAHRMATADGNGERITTIRDAKRLGLYPSVTSILGILAKPGLETWKLNQVALATQRTPRQSGESEEYWCNRVRTVAFEQVEEAADLGTMIHGALELAMTGEAYDQALAVYVEPVVTWAKETGLQIVEREIRLVNRAHGFAGTSDVFFRYGQNGIGILDYKTRKTQVGKPVGAYEDQAMQLAAYAATYWGEANIWRVLAANVFVSTTEPGRMEVVKHPHLVDHWEAFKLAAAMWRYLRGYDPRPRSGGG